MHMVHKSCMPRPSKQVLATCFLRPDRIKQIDLGGIGFESHDRLRGIQYTDFRSLRAGISLRALSTYSKRRHKTLKQIAAMLRRTAHRAADIGDCHGGLRHHTNSWCVENPGTVRTGLYRGLRIR